MCLHSLISCDGKRRINCNFNHDSNFIVISSFILESFTLLFAAMIVTLCLAAILKLSSPWPETQKFSSLIYFSMLGYLWHRPTRFLKGDITRWKGRSRRKDIGVKIVLLTNRFTSFVLWFHSYEVSNQLLFLTLSCEFDSNMFFYEGIFIRTESQTGGISPSPLSSASRVIFITH